MSLSCNRIPFIYFACVALLSLFSTRSAAQLTINTIAGDGSAAFGGDGGPATNARVNNPYAVAVDAAGNIYIADYGNNRIRKIDPSGTISTIGGNGSPGFSGDGGPATSAKIYGPRSVVADAAGNVFFSDYANNRIRKISAAGIISTVAGNGLSGFSGDGGPGTAASLKFPWGVGVDAAGNVYIADQLNCRIRKVNTAGNISTIGGTGIAFFSGDGGPAVAAGIQYPMGIAVDGPGNVYICDEGDCRIRKINTLGIISTVGGNGSAGFTGDGGPATNAKLYYPQGIALDNAGNLFVADLNNYRVRKIAASGVINTVIGNGIAGFSGDGGLPTLAQINGATGVAVDAAGQLYLSDNLNNRIRITHILSHAPIFTYGPSPEIEMCPVEFQSLDSLLTISDVDTGQTETWSVLTPATHGSAVVAYTALSTGGSVRPSGVFYLPTLPYAGPDSFRVRVTDGTYSDTITIHITILPLPVAGTIAGTDSLCPGESFMFTDTASGGVWSSTNSSVATVSGTGLVTASALGTATIQYTVSNICGTATASHTLAVGTRCHTGIAATATGLYGIQVLPNPSQGDFSLSFLSAAAEMVRVDVTSVTGQEIMALNLDSNMPHQVHIDAPAGIYFVTATTAAGRWQARLLIAR